MAESFHLTFLGTGTSVGVPGIGCDCAVCTSDDPRNRRTRASVHLQSGEVSLLVDSGPDLREQALREHLTKVDAVLYTHAHVDHVAGFDELRAFGWRPILNRKCALLHKGLKALRSAAGNVHMQQPRGPWRRCLRLSSHLPHARSQVPSGPDLAREFP